MLLCYMDVAEKIVLKTFLRVNFYFLNLELRVNSERLSHLPGGTRSTPHDFAATGTAVILSSSNFFKFLANWRNRVAMS